MAVIVGINSYVTRGEAEAYFADRLYADHWIDADPEEQDKGLLMARRVLDQQAWLGSIASPDQLLAWPRTGVIDAEGRAVSPTIVPQWIKDAQCELAVAFLREDLTRDPTTRGIRRESKTVGPICKTVEYYGRASERRLPDAVLGPIRPYLAPNANSVKMAM